MKTIKKNVYYCDFCKKRSLRSLKEHEKHCTGNPDRSCQLCDRPDGIRAIGDKFLAMFEIISTDAFIEYNSVIDGTVKIKWIQEFQLIDVINETEQYDGVSCPNCILAVIRYAGLNRYYFKNRFKYDYKGQLESWWESVNEERGRCAYEPY